MRADQVAHLTNAIEDGPRAPRLRDISKIVVVDP